MPMDDEGKRLMGSYSDRIAAKLTAALAPQKIDVVDDSSRHHGHAGARQGGESHFIVTLESAAFAGKNRLERQRMVYALLAEELHERVHALSLKLTAPGETSAP
jgi:BolA protein